MGLWERYRLISRLAKGGMSEVYLALPVSTSGSERPVVVKRMLTHLAPKEEYRAMFLQEARLMASLSHGHVVSVLDFEEVEGEAFLVLEYVEGADLGQVLARGPLAPPLAVYVACCVLRGLAYIHERQGPVGEPLGIVHRDVTPHNLLLGRGGEVKLSDFGIARLQSGPRSTAPGSLKGKVAYMSPEQAEGAPVDARSDLFSLGLVLHEALSGHHPYTGLAGLALLRAAREARIAPLVCEPVLAEVVARALAPAPAERWPSAADMLQALQRCPAAGPAEVCAAVEATLTTGELQPASVARALSPFSRLLREDAEADEDSV